MSSSSAAGNSIRPLIASSQPITPSFGIRIRIAPSSSYALPSATSRAASDAAALGAVELEARLAVPLDPEPAQRLLDLPHRLGHLAARVGVLDPQQALAALAAREEPVEEERAHASDVEEAGRARCHADADGSSGGDCRCGGLHRPTGAPSARTEGSDRISAQVDSITPSESHSVSVTPIASDSGPTIAIADGISTNEPSTS